MPTPKLMLWIVGLAGATYFAISRYEARSAGSPSSAPSRYGR